MPFAGTQSLDVKNNPLSQRSIDEHIPALIEKGVGINWYSIIKIKYT